MKTPPEEGETFTLTREEALERLRSEKPPEANLPPVEPPKPPSLALVIAIWFAILLIACACLGWAIASAIDMLKP